MSKRLPPSKPRHLQLVTSGPTRASTEALDGEDGAVVAHGHMLLQQVAQDGRTRVRGGWKLSVAALLGVALALAGLRLGASRLQATQSGQIDTRRFSMAVFVRHHGDPAADVLLAEHDTVRVDDAWHFALHNRSRKNVWFGLFAATPQGQIYWFYPRDGGGEDIKTLPLPAIVSVTLPDAITPEALSPGPLHVYGVFVPAPVFLTQIESSFAAHGPTGLQAALAADVQTLAVHVVEP